LFEWIAVPFLEGQKVCIIRRIYQVGRIAEGKLGIDYGFFNNRITGSVTILARVDGLLAVILVSGNDKIEFL
jgi:hypothetical protein